MTDTGHNENERAVIDAVRENPAMVFDDPSSLEVLYDYLEAQIDGFEPDTSSAKGRKEIASLSRMPVSFKTLIDDAGKELNAGKRAEINAVDAVRQSLRGKLDALRDKAREPLNEWELQEEGRKARVADFFDFVNQHPAGDIEALEGRLKSLKAMDIEADVFCGDALRAEVSLKSAIEQSTAALAAAKQAELERIELQELRDKEAARQAAVAKKERQDRLEAQAKEQAERDLAQKHAAELQAANDKAWAIQRALEQKKESARQAELAQKAREADANHRAGVIAESTQALSKLGLSEAFSSAVISAIADDQIPHVKIQF